MKNINSSDKVYKDFYVVLFLFNSENKISYWNKKMKS